MVFVTKTTLRISEFWATPARESWLDLVRSYKDLVLNFPNIWQIWLNKNIYYAFLTVPHLAIWLHLEQIYPQGNTALNQLTQPQQFCINFSPKSWTMFPHIQCFILNLNQPEVIPAGRPQTLENSANHYHLLFVKSDLARRSLHITSLIYQQSVLQLVKTFTLLAQRYTVSTHICKNLIPKSDQLQFSLSVSHQRYTCIIQYGEFGNR